MLRAEAQRIDARVRRIRNGVSLIVLALEGRL